MTFALQRRLLQGAVAFACLIPLGMGALSLVHGPAILRGIGAEAPVDLDSHFRYLSGLLLGIGLAFASCIPTIERSTARFQTLGFIVVVGALGRLVSLSDEGTPGSGHLFGLLMELVCVPLLMLWQARLARTAPPAP
jgi:hypothetical protein